jgi:hypothetical protein
MSDDLNHLIAQYQIEKELCDSAPTLDALCYWWHKWTRTVYQIYALISRMGTVGACHVNPAWLGNVSEGD